MARSNQDQSQTTYQMTSGSQTDLGGENRSAYGQNDFNHIIAAGSSQTDIPASSVSDADNRGTDSVSGERSQTQEMMVGQHGPAEAWYRFAHYFSGRSLRYFAGLICAVLCFLVLLLPSPYVIETPGPTQDVLANVEGKPVIAISDATTYKSKGKLLLLTVNAQGVPGSSANGIQTLIAWIDPQQQVMPTEAVFPVGQSEGDYKKTSAKEMTGSQGSATTAALAFARRHKIAGANSAKVKMHIEDVGGPSAGMMYALGVIDKLTPQDETGGKTIAGTGTIDKNGKVGKIGGIQLKMLGAKRDGATYFLAPADNCSEVVGHVPNGLRDVKVSTLDEAYRALVAIGQDKAADLPHCTV